MTFESILATWLAKQRWFAGKGRTVHDLAIVADTEIVSATHGGQGPSMRHLIVCVSHGTTVDSYQLFLGLRTELPDELKHVEMSHLDGRYVYDGLHDSELTIPLLDAIRAGEANGPLRFCPIPGQKIPAGADGLVLTGEQSNTSLVFGESSILKVFRRLAPGPNPDLEVSAALARLGSSHVAEPYGWIETRMDGVTTVLAILSRYLRAASDGWSLAATSVRDLYAWYTDGGLASVDPGALGPGAIGTGAIGAAGEAGGDFAGEAERLGVATAQVHADLAAAFGADELGRDALGELTERMYRKLDL